MSDEYPILLRHARTGRLHFNRGFGFTMCGVRHQQEGQFINFTECEDLTEVCLICWSAVKPKVKLTPAQRDYLVKLDTRGPSYYSGSQRRMAEKLYARGLVDEARIRGASDKVIGYGAKITPLGRRALG